MKYGIITIIIIDSGKSHDPAEDPVRLTNFLKSSLKIETHNVRYHRGEVGYTLGHTQFSDMTDEEMAAYSYGKLEVPEEERLNFTAMPMAPTQMPPSLDLRAQGFVTSVKVYRYIYEYVSIYFLIGIISI